MMQRYAELLGEYGCYFLSVIHLAEKLTDSEIDALRAYRYSVAIGWMGSDCYLQHPESILGKFTGKVWLVSKEDANYKPKPGELEILRFERKETGKTLSHFVVGDLAGGIGWDSYGTSKTGAEGYLVSKRIFRRSA